MKYLNLFLIFFLMSSLASNAAIDSKFATEKIKFINIDQLTWHTPPSAMPLSDQESKILEKNPVSVQFSVTKDGVVIQRHIIAGSQNKLLDQKIMLSLKNVKFRPYLHKNKPIPFRTIQDFIVKEPIIIDEETMSLKEFLNFPN